MIYVSYHEADAATVRDELAPRLRARYDESTVHMRNGELAEPALPVSAGVVVVAVVGDGTPLVGSAGRVVEAALANGIPVVPVLLGTARLPPATDLPADSPLHKLAYLPGVRLRTGPTFEGDLQTLLARVDALHRAGFPPTPPVSDSLAARQQAIDEEAILAGVEEIRRTGGHRFEDLIAELEPLAGSAPTRHAPAAV